jgi:PEP-CTERM motif
MKKLTIVLALLSIGLFAEPAEATSIVYTNESAFLAAISNAATDTFEDLSLTTNAPTPLARTIGPYSYTAMALNSFNPGGNAVDRWLATGSPFDTMNFNNISADVRGIGGYIFGSTIDGFLSFSPQSFSVFWFDGSGSHAHTLVNVTDTSTFFGFVSDSPIFVFAVTVIQPTSGPVWTSIDDLILGTAQTEASAVPEPASVLLLGPGLAAIAWRRLKSRNRRPQYSRRVPRRAP